MLTVLPGIQAQDGQAKLNSKEWKGPPEGGQFLLERLNRMTPEQRWRVLHRLPPQRRRLVEERLERYNSLPPEQRLRLRNRYEVFRHLPVEKQDETRKLFREFSDLPQDRRLALRREIRRLRMLGADERSARLESEQFGNRYSASEQRIIRELSGGLPGVE